jgi:hypothetical protein
MTDTLGASAPSIFERIMEKIADNIELIILFTIFAVLLLGISSV